MRSAISLKVFAARLKDAAKPEWFIKTAIVFLGVNLGAMTIQATGFAFELILAGAAATFVAYLFFWPIVYTLARRSFKLQRDVSAVLASGISVCGASAAIATGGAIRAKPVIPVTVSMLVVIFAMFELIILPGLYTAVFPDQPIVNGAAMGMTVKTDGADAAAGALLDELMIARHLQTTGEQWQTGWILASSVLTKIWIDVFIGIWAFVLALIWVYNVEKRAGQVTVGPSEIWFRFPKFVIGYFVAWLSYIAIVAQLPRGGRDTCCRHERAAKPDAPPDVHAHVRRDGRDDRFFEAQGHGAARAPVRDRTRRRDCSDRVRGRLPVSPRFVATAGFAVTC